MPGPKNVPSAPTSTMYCTDHANQTVCAVSLFTCSSLANISHFIMHRLCRERCNPLPRCRLLTIIDAYFICQNGLPHPQNVARNSRSAPQHNDNAAAQDRSLARCVSGSALRHAGPEPIRLRVVQEQHPLPERGHHAGSMGSWIRPLAAMPKALRPIHLLSLCKLPARRGDTFRPSHEGLLSRV